MFHGISQESFSAQLNSVLMASVDENNIEIKPDGNNGVIYSNNIIARMHRVNISAGNHV